ncbi:MAG: AsnC family transcriptional regulator [Candidatus Micrarchaeota archaeon]|nr:AsnC family transcriptional regulator [Candidatus Micrarchaeota archaeon]MDE1834660.1 AsnC family transcriptional regulator [Candidatus Micrarchaeota archaeon]MDE1859264.1 AsnC family transcriptional regulator [Candidatus Micrarchaeota archaeon]
MESNYDFASKFDEGYSLPTRKLLRYLSEDARASILELSGKVGMSRRTVREKLRKAEQELGIKYTVEFNETALGLTSPHLILAKFIKKPDWDDVKRILGSSYIPQLAVAMKGKYDMLIYANATNSKEYVYWDKRVQIMLSKYGVLWHSSDVAHKQLGYFPIRNELIDRLTIDQEHKEILKLLNQNSRISFSDISKSIKMHFNTVAYNFNKIMQKQYVKRFTIAMTPPKNLTMMSFFSKYILSEKFEEDAAKVRKAYTTNGTDFPLTNRYIICAQLVGSYDFFNLSIFDNYDTAYKQSILYYKDIFKRHKARVEYGVVDRVLLGNLPLRSTDVKSEYNIIRWSVDQPEGTNPVQVAAAPAKK